MPRQNRVTPFGRFEASPARGLLMGNRGILQKVAGGPLRSHAGKAWISCCLTWRQNRVVLDSPRHYTPLFFHDEAVALAAGHRPCALCRRDAYTAFRHAFSRSQGFDRETPAGAKAMDAILHQQRSGKAGGIRMALQDLPDFSFFTLPAHPETALLWHRNHAFAWSHHGYGDPTAIRKQTVVRVLTPGVMLGVLRAGYRPLVPGVPAGGDEETEVGG